MAADRVNDHGGNYICNCDRLTQPHGTPHKPWCDFLKPRPPVVPDPRRSKHTVAELTGGAPRTDSLTMSDNRERTRVPRIEALNAEITGIPEAIGTSEDFPLTSRVGEYLGQPREAAPSTVKRLVCVDVLARGEQRSPDSVPGGEPDALRSAYGALLDAAMDLRRFLQARDGK